MLMQTQQRFAIAQIIPDGTLGSEHSVVTPNVSIDNGLASRIEGGAIRGTNLFHSFTQFNIGDGQRVYFANPVGIENILSRVTGTNPSNILGTLGVEGGANLFFINPNGIIFGENARLDIQGSFVASTAEGVIFDNGFKFSAINPDAPPLLAINVPLGLQYGSNHPKAAIANFGNLAVGQDLTFSADHLDLEGQLYAGRDLTLHGLETVRVRDSVLAPFLATAGNQLLIQGNQSVDIFALNHANSGFFSGGDMVLRSANPVGGDAHYWSGGNFRIEHLDGTLGNLLSIDDPIIRSQGDVSFFAYLGTSLHILAGGSVNIDRVIITGADTTGDTINPTATPTLANVTLSDGTNIVIDGSTRPTLDIRAGMNPDAIGNPLGIRGNNPPADRFLVPNPSGRGFIVVPPPANNPVATSADITIGAVVIDPPGGMVFLTNQYQPNLSLPGGNITITRDIDAQGFDGEGSPVIVDSRSNITLTGSSIRTSADLGNAGDITLLANRNINLTSGSTIFSVSNVGVGGQITLKSNASISAEQSRIFTQSNSPVASTTGGGIEVIAQSLSVTNGAQIISTTSGEGDAGSININATDAISINGENNGYPSTIGSVVARGAGGSGGDVTINTRWLSLTGGQLSASTNGKGNAGNLTIQATDGVVLDGTGSSLGYIAVASQVLPDGEGDGGQLTIVTRSLSALNGAQISTSTFGKGDAGSVMIDASDSVSFDGGGNDFFTSAALTSVEAGAIGNGGDLTIMTGTLSVTNGAQISATTLAQGNAGKVTIQARDGVLLEGEGRNGPSRVTSRVNEEAVGNGSRITITTPSLTITDGAQVSASTAGQGNAGSIAIEQANQVFLDKGSISTAVEQDALAEQPGTIEIQSRSLTLINDAQVTASTSGQGDAGNIFIQNADSVSLSNSSISTAVNAEAVGQGGTVNIQTDSLSLDDRAFISASTAGEGNAGSLFVTANSLELNEGGQLRTNTSSGSDAGNIILNISDRVLLSGENTGLFANSDRNSSGNGGDISIRTPISVLIQDGARIAVDSEGTGVGGNIELQASSLTLENQARLLAETVSNTGGNITLQLQDLLLLRNNSKISTNAGTDSAGGDGGNITINAEFIVAVPKEDSDITANAYQGRGGNINITAQGIYGIEFRPRLTPLSDITVSSEFGVAGVVDINTLDIDLSPGLANLPIEPVNPKVAQDCQVSGGEASSSFINTGRGGLPTNPYEPLSSNDVLADVQPPTQWVSNLADPAHLSTLPQTTPKPIVEAQTWVINDNGEVVLVAEALPTSSHWGCRLR